MCELASAVQRRHVGDLPAFGFFWLPTHKGCCQKHNKLLNCRASSLDIPATKWTFTKNMALLENGRGTAWQGNGMGAARHA
jgi:hypothetical protein